MTQVKNKIRWQTMPVAPHVVWSVIFILVPLAFVAYFALTDDTGKFTLDNFSALAEPTYLATLWSSILYAVIATAICLLVAYPLAYFLSKMKARYQQLFVMLIMLPMWTNFLIRTYTMSQILEKNGIVNTILMKLGMEEPIQFLGTGAAVVFGMVYNYLPYMVLPIYTVLMKLDHRLIEAAQDLGCNGFSTLTRVILPLSRTGMISGVTMVFVPCISTFYISQAMSKRTITLFGDVIEAQFKSINNYNVGAMLSAVLMILVLISMWVMYRFGDDTEGVVA